MTVAWRCLLAVFAAIAAVGLGACGDEPAPQMPPKVAVDVAPSSVQGGTYKFYESGLPQVRDTFANAGPRSLVADGRLWELRRDDRLVGILQVSTLMPKLDLLDSDHRNQIIDQIMPTARDQITVGDVQVFTSVANEKSVYLWFAEHTFNLLTLKPASGDDLDPERVLTEVVDYQTSLPSWKPVYFDDEELEDGSGA